MTATVFPQFSGCGSLSPVDHPGKGNRNEEKHLASRDDLQWCTDGERRGACKRGSRIT